MHDTINGAMFKEMLLFGTVSIAQAQQAINDLNVFPVPDGDTGTNMSLTIQTAAQELKKIEPATVDQAASVTASALLRGARGNSGVILSLLFRGISKELKGCKEADGAAFAAALQEGVAAAYNAVMKPAEGTILTVSRLAAERAVNAAEEHNSVEYVIEQAIAQGEITLAQTTDMNPVLKKAGVVDAGGKGFLLILGGMLSALRGEERPELTEENAQEKADFAMLNEEDITFTFDTVFIVRKSGRSIEPFRRFLDSIGDSLVIGEDDEAFKVHVHTDIPGEALTEAQKYGTLELAKIENMRTQAQQLAAGGKAQSTDDLEAIEQELEAAEHENAGEAEPEKDFGFLAVCAGEASDYAYAKKSLGLTHRWLDRCIRRFNETEPRYGYQQSLFPIVQGCTYKDLRIQSAEFVASKEADGNAIGGLAVGEPAEVMYEMIEVVNGILPKDKPRYLMGVGTPVNILEGIERGVDMFDCVMPTRNGRNAMLFTQNGIMNLRNKKWEDDFSPLDPDGTSYVDKAYSKAYLHHLFKAQELLALQIASIHNLAFYLWLTREARRHIIVGDFSSWKALMVKRVAARL